MLVLTRSVRNRFFITIGVITTLFVGFLVTSQVQTRHIETRHKKQIKAMSSQIEGKGIFPY